MVLTDRQRGELEAAILEYLQGEPNLEAVAEQFAGALGLEPAPPKAPDATGILEKKWTSVVRLQRKVLELESKVKSLEAERKTLGPAMGGGAMLKSGETYLLKPTARHRLSGHRAPVTSVRFHPRFNLLVTTSEDATIKVWDFETGEFERTLKGHTNVVQDACFDAEGLLATCSSDLSVKLWNVAKGECVKTLVGHDHNVTGVAFLKAGQLVSCSRDKSLKVWDTNSGYCVKTLTGHDDWVRKVAVHEASGLVASCSSDHSVRLWRPAAADELQAELIGHEHVVECVAFSSAAADKAIAPVSATPSEAAGSRAGGLHVVSGSRDRTVRVWQVASASCLFVLEGHDNWVRAVAFQPHGRHLVTASEDKSLRMWDVKERRCLRTVSAAHSHFVSCMDLHPTYALAASGSVDQEVAVWAAAPAI